MFDSAGNFWVADNFSVGWQGQDSLWEGHATKFAPNGRALSPITTGFTGGGMEGGTFGTAVDSTTMPGSLPTARRPSWYSIKTASR
jgi:hypothetical protein